MKKAAIILLICVLPVWVFAQENKSSLAMGFYIETTSNNTFLIRDIATGKKAGFEFDRSSIYTKGNWWFWGNIGSLFLLDAEVGVWEADIPLYQANSFGGNVPDTTWADGFQGLASVFFAPLFGLNGPNAGHFNKLGFNITTPWVKTRIGYSLLKGGGMSTFTGLYNVITSWDDVGRGYTEFHLGDGVSKIGDAVTLNAFVALSRMRAEYGVYSLVDASFSDRAEAAVTFNSTTNSGELFRYNEQNQNAFSFYGSYNVIDFLKLSLHGLTSFGTGFESGAQASAMAVGAEGKAGIYSGKLILSLAGPNSMTVWGDDSTLNPDSLSVHSSQWFAANKNISIGLDTDAYFNDTKKYSDGFINIRNQPMIDYNLADLLGVDMSVSVYGVLQADRIALDSDPNQPWAFRFEEAGLELRRNDLPFMKKIVFDYAIRRDYKDWNKGYSLDMMYNSFMLSGDINDKLGALAGAVIRTESLSPLGIAIGANIKTSWGFGAPRLWSHIAYGMDPFEDNNYTLFRADDPLNRPVHRTYLLHALNSFIDSCRISIGLIWDL